MISLRQKIRLSANFFDVDFFAREKNKIFKLKVRDFFLNKNVSISFDQFRTNSNLDLSREQFNKIRDMCKMAVLLPENLHTCFEPSVQAWILYKAPQWNARARYPNSCPERIKLKMH